MLARLFRKLIDMLGANDRVFFRYQHIIFQPTEKVNHFQDSIVIELEVAE